MPGEGTGRADGVLYQFLPQCQGQVQSSVATVTGHKISEHLWRGVSVQQTFVGGFTRADSIDGNVTFKEKIVPMDLIVNFYLQLLWLPIGLCIDKKCLHML